MCCVFLSRAPIRPTAEGTLTAANLIDAIITHSINNPSSSEPPNSLQRDSHRSGFVSISPMLYAVIFVTDSK